MILPPISQPGDFSYTPHTPEEIRAHQEALEAKLLAESQTIDDAYANLGGAEAFECDMRALVYVAKMVINSADNTGCSDDLTVVSAKAIEDLEKALEQFEPWLEQDNDPRSMGWVDGKGRP